MEGYNMGETGGESHYIPILSRHRTHHMERNLRTQIPALKLTCIGVHRRRGKTRCKQDSANFCERLKLLSQEPLVHYVARMYTDSQGHVSILSAMWVSTLVLAFIFASVHQTAAVAVWVVFELSIQKEYLASVQEELSAIADGIDSGGVHKLTYDALRRSTVLDSFIREVLRTKGDTLSAARETVRDVSLAGYTIPEGSFVSPMATLTHRSRTLYSEKAAEFDPNRWLEGPASSTIDPGYLPFGFGRWACPGHILAVTEIKMIVLTLLAISVPEVEGGEYIVVDPMNVTSVPPVGRLLLHPLNPKPNNN